MSDDEYNDIKPQKITESKFKSQADEYLSKLEEFKKTEKKMKQMEVNIKKYMIDKEIREYKNENGSFTIIERKVNLLDRSLIEDIEKYYKETHRVVMYKSII